jgi:hypothetical protein
MAESPRNSHQFSGLKEFIYIFCSPLINSSA